MFKVSSVSTYVQFRRGRRDSPSNFQPHKVSYIVNNNFNCDSVFSPLPQYLLKRLQKIEFAAASFVYGRYVNGIGDILKLNWLPVHERRDFNLLKLIFKALYFKQWPTYLNLQRVSIRRQLRSSDCIRLQVPLEKGTFQDTAALLFNNLPKELKTCDDVNIFTSRLFKYLRNRAKTCLQ